MQRRLVGLLPSISSERASSLKDCWVHSMLVGEGHGLVRPDEQGWPSRFGKVLGRFSCFYVPKRLLM